MADVIRFAPYLIIAAILAGGGFYVSNLRADNKAMRAELATKDALIERNRRTALLFTEYLNRDQAAREAEDELQRDLNKLEGRDVPLSDHLRAATGRVWP